MQNFKGQSTSGIVIAVIIIIIIIGGVWWYVASGPSPTASSTPTGTPSADEQAVNAAVVGFGDQLGQVSLLASSTDVAASMEQYYSAYVDPDLLAQWESAPSSSPGRLTSSPYPDHVTISSTVQNADGTYTVYGQVVEMASTGQSGTFPFTATVANEGGSWLITSWSGYPPQQTT